MFKALTSVLFAISILTVTPVQASDQKAPSCWKSENSKVLDGVFYIRFSTEGRSARDMASLIKVLSSSDGANIVSIGPDTLTANDPDQLGSVLIEYQAISLPTAGDPSFIAMIHDSVIQAVTQALSIPGVSASCFIDSHPNANPGGTVSN